MFHTHYNKKIHCCLQILKYCLKHSYIMIIFLCDYYSNKPIISFQQGVTNGYPVAVSIVRIFYCICRSRKKNYSNSTCFPKFSPNLKNLLVIKVANLHHFSSNWDDILLVKEQKAMIIQSSTKKTEQKNLPWQGKNDHDKDTKQVCTDISDWIGGEPKLKQNKSRDHS